MNVKKNNKFQKEWHSVTKPLKIIKKIKKIKTDNLPFRSLILSSLCAARRGLSRE
jgi:hypothetical protein